MKVVIALLVLCAVAVQAAPNVAGKWEATYPYTRSGGQKEFEHVDVPFYLCPNEDGSLWYQSYGQVYGQLSGYSILTPEANTDDSVVTLSGMYYEADFQSPSISYPALRSGYQVLNFTYEYVYRVGMPATRNLVLNGVQYSFGSKSAKGSNSAFTAVPVASLDFETYCMVPAATVADNSPAGRWIGGNGLIGISDANDFCFFEGKKPYFQGSTQNSGGFYFAGVTMSDTNAFLFFFFLSSMASMFLVFVFSLLLFYPFLCFSYEARNHEVEALIAIRRSLDDPKGVLSNWDEDSVDPCSWAMISCSSENLVIALGAPSQGLSGVLSGMISNLTNLKQVLLQNNNISGHIPRELGKLPNLETLDLSNNHFSGHVPDSLGLLNSLQYLRLNNNSLSGAIPLSLARVPQLAFLDLSFNNLSGPIPKFPTRTFNVVGNPLICGNHSAETCFGSVNLMPLSFDIDSTGKRNSKRLAIAMGLSISFISLFLLGFGFIIWKRNQNRKQSILNINDMQEEDLVRLGNLRSFTFKELQRATNSFSSKNILGAGGFGNVYRGKLGDGSLVAVKRLKDISGTAGESQFRTELELISLAVHRNLLRLIGYCATPNERLLVYPFMSNGSVAARLRGKPALDWTTRKRIAIGAARGLLYLHEQCDPKIIHRDVKAANVLLDDFCEAVVGDFGLAKLLDHADSHVTTAVRGTVGHIAPEYLSTGQSSEKTDVFGFGILLLELITGMRALELGKTVNQKGAVLEWVKKMQHEKNVEALIDRELGSNYDRIDVGEMLQVAILCTQYLPSHRPKMSEVVRMLEGDGLAEKWAASHNYDGFSLTKNSNKTQTKHSMVPLGYDDHDHDHLTMLGMMDDDYDTHAMELSGPR